MIRLRAPAIVIHVGSHSITDSFNKSSQQGFHLGFLSGGREGVNVTIAELRGDVVILQCFFISKEYLN